MWLRSMDPDSGVVRWSISCCAIFIEDMVSVLVSYPAMARIESLELMLVHLLACKGQIVRIRAHRRRRARGASVHDCAEGVVVGVKWR